MMMDACCLAFIVTVSLTWTTILSQPPNIPGMPPFANPDDTWYYHMISKNDDMQELTHFQRFTEMEPRSSILCPKDFYLSKLSYNFLARVTDAEIEESKKSKSTKIKYAFTNITLDTSQLLEAVTTDFISGYMQLKSREKRDVSANVEKVIKENGKVDSVLSKRHPSKGKPMKPIGHPKGGASKGKGHHKGKQAPPQPSEPLHWPGADHQYGPCAPLVYCIGHQSCSFHLSNKFCQNDPVPGWRKTLDVTFTCSRASPSFDSLAKTYVERELTKKKTTLVVGEKERVLEYFRGWEDSTVKLVYKEEVDHDQEAEFYPPLQTMNAEEEVFDIKCPSLTDAAKMGYIGQCTESSPDAIKITKDLWKILARASDQICRQEIIEIYCAYKYSPNGKCYPPFTQKAGVTGDKPDWSFKVVPEKGKRMDLKEYNKIYNNYHLGLIPVRIGFFILAHESPAAVMELLHSIYSEENFYVVHIDSREVDIRNELDSMVSAIFGAVGNVRVLTTERSFATSWGSWFINRAELECIEELLRMGVWDFSINLSGADLAMRNMSDLAAMLAPYRGRTITRINIKLDYDMDPPIQSAWHSCNGHVYNVSYGSDKSVDRYSHSQFGMWSRDYLEFLLSKSHPEVTDKYQFPFVTAFIPDEQYLGTLLKDSPFNTTIVKDIFTFLKPFVGETSENLCRHSEETDSCGQGPATFNQDDLRHLHSQLHHFFFARKFSTNTGDPVRKAVLQMNKDNTYAGEVLHNLPQPLLRNLAKEALDSLKSQNGKDLTEFKNIVIDVVKVVPRLLPAHPCCEEVAKLGIQLISEYTYIIDFTVNWKQQNLYLVETAQCEGMVEVEAARYEQTLPTPSPSIRMIGKSGKSTKVRTSVDTSPSHSHSCYPQGHLRLVHMTTRRDMNGPPDGRPEPAKMNFPLPTNPIGGDVVWLHLMVHIGNLSRECKAQAENDMVDKHFATWDLSQLENESKAPPPFLSFDITLVSPSGEVLFHDTRSFNTGMAGKHQPGMPPNVKMDMNMWTTPMPISKEQGVYTVTVKENGPDNPHTYCQSIYIVDEAASSTYLDGDVLKLWKVSDVALLDDLDAKKYYASKQLKTMDPKQESNVHNLTPKPTIVKDDGTNRMCKIAEEIAGKYRDPFNPFTAMKLAGLVFIIMFAINFYRCHRPVAAFKKSFTRRVFFSVVFLVIVQFIVCSYHNSLLPSITKSEL